MKSAKKSPEMEIESVVVYVQDALGDKYCYSVNDPKYADKAKKHARWWMRQRNHKKFDGTPLYECRPLKLVIENIYVNDR